MAFDGFLKKLKDGAMDELGKQIGMKLTGGGSGNDGASGSGGSGSAVTDLIPGIIGLFGNRGGGSSGGPKGIQFVGSLINTLQQGNNGAGFLPGNVAKYLPAILKLAEIIGHGMGDDTPRTEQNPDGSFIDNFVKTIIGGRKIFGPTTDVVKPVKKVKGGGFDEVDGGGASHSVQDYETIKRECLENGVLFEDPEFPAEDASVFFSRSGQRDFQWLRPGEICSDPSFFLDEATRFDVKQGELGDCWLLAAVANLTLNMKLFYQVVPEDNSFQNDYCGIFHFRFWQYGHWVDVVVDDRLPTINGKLMFMHSEDCSEFWSALLEKAYAKLQGSYEALKGGTTNEALEDFTGGVTEMYDIRSSPKEFFQMIMKAFDRSSFLGCSIEPDPRKLEAETEMGLIRGHAYSVTGVQLLQVETPNKSGKIPLLRIKNPWGNEVEWKGAWADGSPEWNWIDEETKEDIGLTFDSDGEFWMSFRDFTQNFDQLEFCNLSPDSLEEDEAGKKQWNLNTFEGSWVAGETAGGCRNYLDTFATNPQYPIELIDPDEDDDDDKCTIIVALMQKNRRAQRKFGVECLTIGFAIYAIKDDQEPPFEESFFKFNASVARSPSFINLREVSCRFRLPVGKYVIVPSTFEPNQEGEFLIRVFSEGKHV